MPIFQRGGKNYYFLWSLERVGVAYGLKTIGDKDWYAFGAEVLVANQQNDGSWHGDFAICGADTCFALLFLKRANLTRDLTSSLNKNPAPEPPPAATRPAVPAIPSIQASAANPPAPHPEKPRLIEKLRTADIVPAGHVEPPKERMPSLALAATAEADAARLSTELVNAPAARQTEVLDKFCTCKEAAYSQALMSAIPKLSAGVQPKAQRCTVGEHDLHERR